MALSHLYIALALLVLPLYSIADQSAVQCSAYVRFVSTSKNMAPGLFFTARDSRDVHVISSVLQKKVGPYVAIEPGFIDIRVHNVIGQLEVKRTFIATGTNGYTIILYDNQDRTDFAIIADNIRHLNNNKFTGTYYNLSPHITDFSIARIIGDNKRELVVAPSVKIMGSYEYGALDFGLYNIQSNILWVGHGVPANKYFNINEPIIADLFVFEADAIDNRVSNSIELVKAYVDFDSNGCIRPRSVQ